MTKVILDKNVHLRSRVTLVNQQNTRPGSQHVIPHDVFNLPSALLFLQCCWSPSKPASFINRQRIDSIRHMIQRYIKRFKPRSKLPLPLCSTVSLSNGRSVRYTTRYPKLWLQASTLRGCYWQKLREDHRGAKYQPCQSRPLIDAHYNPGVCSILNAEYSLNKNWSEKMNYSRHNTQNYATF